MFVLGMGNCALTIPEPRKWLGPAGFGISLLHCPERRQLEAEPQWAHILTKDFWQQWGTEVVDCWSEGDPRYIIW